MSKRTINAETAPLWRTIQPSRRDSVFRTIEHLAKHGFHAWKIAQVAGCSVAQVYQACAKLQIRLRDYRDGLNDEAKQVIVEVAPIRAQFKKVR